MTLTKGTRLNTERFMAQFLLIEWAEYDGLRVSKKLKEIKMKGKIGIEEHWSNEEFVVDGKPYFILEGKWEESRERLMDVHGQRIEHMDANGIEYTILSQTAPAVQRIVDPTKAIESAKRSNDELAELVAKNPKRFGTFAQLPLQDPDAAIKELHRCVKDLGVLGIMINGFSNVTDEEGMLYYDLPQYWPFWAEVEKLDLPFYLHPRYSVPSVRRIYEGHQWLIGAAWGFGVETATHALRLIGSGLFDKYPKLRIILGHLGEMIPFQIWRLTNRINGAPRGVKCKRSFQYYWENNFYVTTAGHCNLPAMQCCLSIMGDDKVIFSTDYPYETMKQAADWFDAVELGDVVKQKIGRDNAKRIFKLDFLS